MPYVGLGNSAVKGGGHIPPGLNPKILSVTSVNEYTNDIVWENYKKINDPSFDFAYVTIEKSEDNVVFKELAQFFSDPWTTFTDITCVPGANIWYRAVTITYKGPIETRFESQPFLFGSITASLVSPTNVSTTPFDNNQFTVTWDNAPGIPPSMPVEIRLWRENDQLSPPFPRFVWSTFEGYGITVTAADSIGILCPEVADNGIGNYISIMYKDPIGGTASELTTSILGMPTTQYLIPQNITGVVNQLGTIDVTWTNPNVTIPVPQIVAFFTTNDPFNGGFNSTDSATANSGSKTINISHNPSDANVYFRLQFQRSFPNAYSPLSGIVTVPLNP